MLLDNYTIPAEDIPLDYVRGILKGDQCGSCINPSTYIDTQRDLCRSCVLQGTTIYSANNSLSNLNIDIFLKRLLQYKVITKTQALDLTLYIG